MVKGQQKVQTPSDRNNIETDAKKVDGDGLFKN